MIILICIIWIGAAWTVAVFETAKEIEDRHPLKIQIGEIIFLFGTSLFLWPLVGIGATIDLWRNYR